MTRARRSGSSVSRWTFTRRSPARRSGGRARGSRMPFVVIARSRDAGRSPRARATISSRSARSVGSPPVRRIFRKPTRDRRRGHRLDLVGGQQRPRRAEARARRAACSRRSADCSDRSARCAGSRSRGRSRRGASGASSGGRRDVNARRRRAASGGALARRPARTPLEGGRGRGDGGRSRSRAGRLELGRAPAGTTCWAARRPRRIAGAAPRLDVGRARRGSGRRRGATSGSAREREHDRQRRVAVAEIDADAACRCARVGPSTSSRSSPHLEGAARRACPQAAHRLDDARGGAGEVRRRARARGEQRRRLALDDLEVVGRP